MSVNSTYTSSVSSDDRENVPPTHVRGKPNVPADKSHEFRDSDDVRSWVYDPLENYLILRLQTLMEHRMLESIPVKKLGQVVSEYLEMDVNPATNWKKTWKKVAAKWARLGCFELRDETLYPNKEILEKLSEALTPEPPVEGELQNGDFLKTIDTNLPMSPKFNDSEDVTEKNDEGNENGSVYEEEIKDFKCDVEPIPSEENHYVDDGELQEPGDYSPKNLIGTPKACVATPHGKSESIEGGAERKLSSVYEREIKELARSPVGLEADNRDRSPKQTPLTAPQVLMRNEEDDERVEYDDEIVDNAVHDEMKEMPDTSRSDMEPSTIAEVQENKEDDEGIEDQEIDVEEPAGLGASPSDAERMDEVAAESEMLGTSRSTLNTSSTMRVEEKTREDNQETEESVTKHMQVDASPVRDEAKEEAVESPVESEEQRSPAVTVEPSSIEGEDREEETSEKPEGPRKNIKSSHHVRKCCFFL